MFFRFILTILYYVLLSNHTFANFDITIEKLYPPKCSILKDSKVLLCPRIMEIDVKIGNQKYKNDFHGAIQTIEIFLSYINFALL